MQRRHSLDLCDTAPGQLCGSRDAHARITEADNAAMVCKVGFAAGVPPFPFGDFYPFALTFTPGFIIVACCLKRYP